ncbi:MAG TPA: hypothetical protein VK843_18030 [Planctomycetota bacterium]|nr:hypothetical protein [Planctomycetota bacterium]
MNRHLLLSTLLVLCATMHADDTLTWRVAKGTTLARSFESKAQVELQSMSVKVDDEEQEAGPTPEMTVNQASTYEFSDTIEAIEHGEPAKIVRHFTKISSMRSRTMKQPDEEALEEESALESELEGKSVVFAREGSSWTAKWAEESDADEKLLKGLEAEVDFRSFLPDKEVSVDDSWELEASTFLNFVRPGGHLSRKAEGEDAARVNAREAMLDDSIEGKCTATYRGTREEAGVKVGVIALVAEVTLHSSEDIDNGEAGVGESKLQLSYKLEGEILWDVKGGFARSAALSGSLELTQTHHVTAKSSEGEHEFEQVMTFSGETSYKAAYEPKS